MSKDQNTIELIEALHDAIKAAEGDQLSDAALLMVHSIEGQPEPDTFIMQGDACRVHELIDNTLATLATYKASLAGRTVPDEYVLLLGLALHITHGCAHNAVDPVAFGRQLVTTIERIQSTKQAALQEKQNAVHH